MAEKNNDGYDSIWVIVPLAALMIPIIAVSDGSNVIVWGVAAAFVIIAAGMVARSLMDRAHRHRLAELEAKARLEAAERARLDRANQILDNDERVEELRRSLRRVDPPESDPDQLSN